MLNSDDRVNSMVLSAESSTITLASDQTESTGSSPASDKAFNSLQFALQILSPDNDAVSSASEFVTNCDLSQPLAQYWVACSHSAAPAIPTRVSVRLALAKWRF